MMAKRVPPYKVKKLADQAKLVIWLQKNRIQRFRSSVFSLPEFTQCPIISVITRVHSGDEMKQLFDCMNSQVDQVEWGMVINEGISVTKTLHITEILDVTHENECMAINRAAIGSSGKIIAIFSSPLALQRVGLEGIVKAIEENEEHLLACTFDEYRCHIAMARDMFFLARGLDEMMVESEPAMQDLALRAELLGARLDKKFNPVELARVHVSKGELMVNEGSDNFRKLYFEPR